jgi:hypothetical protein
VNVQIVNAHAKLPATRCCLPFWDAKIRSSTLQCYQLAVKLTAKGQDRFYRPRTCSAEILRVGKRPLPLNVFNNAQRDLVRQKKTRKENDRFQKKAHARTRTRVLHNVSLEWVAQSVTRCLPGKARLWVSWELLPVGVHGVLVVRGAHYHNKFLGLIFCSLVSVPGVCLLMSGDQTNLHSAWVFLVCRRGGVVCGLWCWGVERCDGHHHRHLIVIYFRAIP